MKDIRNKLLRTVDKPGKVFGEDGLRLLRLARFAGATGFSPTPETLDGAKTNAVLIADVSPERIFAELKQILCSERKYGNADGIYQALEILDETRVLDGIFPILRQAKSETRADFHNHDVLEHSLRAAAYSARANALADVSPTYPCLSTSVWRRFCTISESRRRTSATENFPITRTSAPYLPAWRWKN